MSHQIPARTSSNGRVHQTVKVMGLLVLCLIYGEEPLASQQPGQIAVQVTGQGGEPVRAARVQILQRSVEGVTAADGRLVIPAIPPGTYPVRITALGYRDVTEQVSVAAGAMATLNVVLEVRPIELQGVQVHVLRPDLQHRTELEAERVMESNPRDAGDALRELPGVDAVRKGPVGLDPVVRGLRETEVGTYLDGARMFPAGPARMDSPLTHLDPTNIQHVEVVKGPYALTWGAGNLAAIRVETRGVPPQIPGAIHGRFLTGYDSNIGAQEYSGSVYGSDGPWAYWGSAVWRTGSDYQSGDDVTVPGDFESWEVRGKVGYRTSDASWLSISAGYQEQGPIDYPGRLLTADFFETVNLNGAWRLDRSEGLLRAMEISAYVNDVQHAMDNEGKPTREAVPTRTPPFALDVKVDASVQVTGGRVSATLLPTPDWTFEVGGDVYRATRDATRTIDRLDAGMKPPTFPLVDLMWPDATITDGGIWARAEHPFGGRFRLSGALRVDRVSADAGKTPSDFFLANTSGNLSASETNLNGALTLSANLSPNWNFSIGGGTVVRTADATERYSDRTPASKAQISAEFMGNPALDPERSSQVDLWLEARYPRLGFDANLFARRIDDYITMEATELPTRLPLSPPTVYRYVNGDAEFWGLETNLSFNLTGELTAGLGGEYLWGKDLALDEPALGVAPLRGDVSLRYSRAGGAYFIGGNLLAVGRQDRLATTRGEIEDTPGYSLLNIQVGFRPYPGFLVRVGVQNLGDTEYYNHLNAKNPFTGVPIPEPGRSIFLRTTYSF